MKRPPPPEAPHPTDFAGMVTALMAVGASREKAIAYAMFTRTVLWPAMDREFAERMRRGEVE